MKVGLIDVDGHNFPNLAPMKEFEYHTIRKDNVGWANSLEEYDLLYISKVFTFSEDYTACIKADKIIRGGSGYDLENKLPPEIENCSPNYSIYPQFKEAYGFLTRGCPRNCPFCIVGQKEGCKSYKVADLGKFWTDQKVIKLLDPNLLACKDKYDLLQQLVDSKAYVDFTQGLDIRFLDEDVVNLIKQIKLKIVHFAWDRDDDSERIIRNLKSFKDQTQIDRRKAAVYVLTNYETEFEFDLFRVYKLKELGYDPYVMIFDKEEFLTSKGKLKPMEQLLKKYTIKQINHFKKCWRLQRWVNNKILFMSCEKFEDYKS